MEHRASSKKCVYTALSGCVFNGAEFVGCSRAVDLCVERVVPTSPRR